MIQENAMKRQVLLYALGAFIGVVSGITAVLFRLLILSISQVFTIIPQVLGVAGWIIVPVLGGLIVAFIVVRYAPEAKGHGVPEVIGPAKVVNVGIEVLVVEKGPLHRLEQVQGPRLQPP